MFPWIPLLTAGLGIIGNLFGKQENTTATQAQNTNTTQTQSGTTAGTTGQKTQQQSTATTTQQENQTGQQASNQNTTQSNTATKTGQTNRLDDSTLALLTQNVRDNLTSNTSTQAALTQQLADVKGADSNFDADAFVKGITDQARSQIGSDLESGVNGVSQATGASSKSNSAASLLSAKLRGQAADNLAGVKSQAMATAEDIKNKSSESKTSQIGALATGAQNGTGSLLNTLLGASETETAAQTDAGVTGTSGTTTSSQNTGTTNNSTQTTNQNVAGVSGQQTDGTSTSKTASKTAGTQNTQTTDWTKLFSGLSSIFSTQF